MKEKKINISVNEEDVQNLINCYEKDIEYIKKLEKESKELQERIKKYEDPEDLTLMFMYCDVKIKDKIKELKERINLYKSVINDIKHILNNQMDYREFVDIVNAIEEILERVN